MRSKVLIGQWEKTHLGKPPAYVPVALATEGAKKVTNLTSVLLSQ